MHDRDQNDEAGLQAPESLVKALRQSPPDRIPVPAYVDSAVLRAAERHLAKPRPTRRTLVRLFWPALASTCVLIVWFALVFNDSDRNPAVEQFAREDLNRDGSVDILDAFILARQIQEGESISLQQDFNGDGLVDHRDVEHIAANAVKLDKGRPS